MRAKIPFLITLFLAVAGIWFFYQTAAVSSRGGEDAPLYSTERHDPYGTAAIRDLLAERGVPTAVLMQPRPDDTLSGAVLIQVLTHNNFTGSAEKPLRNEQLSPQLQSLEDWLARGNTIIQFTRTPTDLLAAYDLGGTPDLTNNVKIESAEAAGKSLEDVPEVMQTATWSDAPTPEGLTLPREPAEIDAFSPLILFPAVRGGPPSTAPATATAPGPIRSAWHPLATHLAPAGPEWIAAVRPVGRGRLIVVGSPTPILNQSIAERANLDFVLSLIAPPEKLSHTPVIFDEWSHGIGHEGTIIGFIRQVGLLPVLFQLMFVVVLYVWATSGFHPRDTMQTRRRRSSSEQIETLAHLYSQSMKPAMLFEKVHTEVRRRLASALRTSPASLEAAIAHAPPDIATKAREILGHLNDIGRGRGPTCPNCGYDLTRNVTGKCSECGHEIPWTLKERIVQAEAVADVPERKTRNSRKTDARLAGVLRESQLFSEELTRVRTRRH